LDAVAAKPAPIDWDFYSKNISKPGLVEAFRKAVSPYIIYSRCMSFDALNEKV